ncbi:MAG: DUF2905 domain-containing protein [Candidatus Aenigmarchaeota archaeon]|nr:DUF2905 domain-containing protein [Candidatus Aenigmarchaeota archaeon]
MSGFEGIGSMLIVAGGLLLLSGLILVLGEKTPLGKLPGDILIEKGNFKFYAPIATFLVISLILTIFVNFFLK